MDTLNKLIKFESVLSSIEAPILKYFNSGISKETIIENFNLINLIPSPDLISLYEWKNGMSTPSDMPSGKTWFGVGCHFYSLKDSIVEYNLSIKEEFYENHFFPIFHHDTFLINLDHNSEDFNKIFIYCPALTIIEPESYYDSINNMIDTLTVCFEKRISWYDSEDFIQYDPKQFFAICKELNPKSMHWRQ
jgi:hypothetical protein